MRPFTCTRCQHTVFFENDHCGSCGAWLGFVPALKRLVAFEPALPPQGLAEAPAEAAVDAPVDAPAPVPAAAAWLPVEAEAAAGITALMPCANRLQYAVCNWMLDAGDEQPLCRSCRLNATLPDLSVPGHLERWARFESAKRRWLYTLLQLGLAPEPKRDAEDVQGLALHMLAPQPDGDPVMTGHAEGLVTLNLLEADDVHRETARAAFGEPWRTLLGHFRHEGAHYLHHRWIQGDDAAEAEWRAAFGDERADYGEALARYHEQGPQAGWEGSFISAYASAHPHEDWAETCSHWLLIVDAVETAGSWGLSLASPAASADPGAVPVQALRTDELLLSQWLPVAQFLNAMNRSLGLRDSYPFLLPDPVIAKMGTVARLLRRAGGASV